MFENLHLYNQSTRLFVLPIFILKFLEFKLSYSQQYILTKLKNSWLMWCKGCLIYVNIRQKYLDIERSRNYS